MGNGLELWLHVENKLFAPFRLGQCCYAEFDRQEEPGNILAHGSLGMEARGAARGRASYLCQAPVGEVNTDCVMYVVV